MRVLALISGGKDSIFAAHVVHASGHELVALGHIAPSQGGEPDSEMYQSVATEGVHIIAEAMELPLLIQMTDNTQKCAVMNYSVEEGDEVEDLYLLLQRAKLEFHIEAICCGALLSDYQRIRVENVCTRLNLINFAPIWQKDQNEYLADLESLQIDSIIVKVAAIGLGRKHLGQKLADVREHLEQLQAKFGVHPAGEGGELESYVLDSPLYKRRIVIEESKVVTHSDDFGAPVLYMSFGRLGLAEKTASNANWVDHPSIQKYRSNSKLVKSHLACSTVIRKGLLLLSGLCGASFGELRPKIEQLLTETELDVASILAVQLFVRDLSQFGAINKEYSAFMNGNYPTRTCVEIELPPQINIVVSLIATDRVQRGVNVRVESRSTWASCIVGPYSQACRLNREGDECTVPSNLLYSGLIGLRSFEHLLGCGATEQRTLAHQHQQRLTELMVRGANAEPVIEQYGFVTSSEFSTESTFDLVVPCLPRGALLELVPFGFFENGQMKRQLHVDCEGLLSMIASCTQNEAKHYQVTAYVTETMQGADATLISDRNWVAMSVVFIRKIMRGGVAIRNALVIDEIDM